MDGEHNDVGFVALSQICMTQDSFLFTTESFDRLQLSKNNVPTAIVQINTGKFQ